MNESRYSLSVPDRGASVLSEQEYDNIRQQLFLLLPEQVRLYTSGESSSVPAETAEELFKSLCFTAKKALEISPSETSGKKLAASGREIIKEQMKKGLELLKTVEGLSPQVDNIAYFDTLREIRAFFKRYDYRFFAHDIPCSIDYPLCHPLPENMFGIEYICEYLLRLSVENAFCRRFSAETIKKLLEAYCSDYEGLLINIYEPIAVNAIGLALLEKDIPPLDVTHHDRELLQEILKGLSEAEVLKKLEAASEYACRMLLVDNDMYEYLLFTAKQLTPRLKSALENNSLSGVFLSIAASDVKEDSPCGFIHGKKMPSESLRRLIRDMQNCQDTSEKISLVKENVKNIYDMADILNICFWGDECEEMLFALEKSEIELLKTFIQSKDALWSSETGWEKYLRNI